MRCRCSACCILRPRRAESTNIADDVPAVVAAEGSGGEGRTEIAVSEGRGPGVATEVAVGGGGMAVVVDVEVVFHLAGAEEGRGAYDAEDDEEDCVMRNEWLPNPVAALVLNWGRCERVCDCCGAAAGAPPVGCGRLRCVPPVALRAAA